jgi:hypothetical protein
LGGISGSTRTTLNMMRGYLGHRGALRQNDAQLTARTVHCHPGLWRAQRDDHADACRTMRLEHAGGLVQGLQQ